MGFWHIGLFGSITTLLLTSELLKNMLAVLSVFEELTKKLCSTYALTLDVIPAVTVIKTMKEILA